LAVGIHHRTLPLAGQHLSLVERGGAIVVVAITIIAIVPAISSVGIAKPPRFRVAIPVVGIAVATAWAAPSSWQLPDKS
jgi:hypothetical protein